MPARPISSHLLRLDSIDFAGDHQHRHRQHRRPPTKMPRNLKRKELSSPANTTSPAAKVPRSPKRKHLSSPEPYKPSPEPYPEFPSPSHAQCRAVRDALLAADGFPDEFAAFRDARLRGSSGGGGGGGGGETVLDGLVTTLLSQNTTDANSRRAFASLKSAFPSWDQVVDADSKQLEDAIRCGGLAATKAARIKAILKAVREKRGEICLEYLRGLPVDVVKTELSWFKGIGPKTVACVLMFYLQQDDFPVDTHVLRITKAIGWVPMTASREKAYLHLNKKIPDELKFDLNCLFVTHGKLCQLCTKKFQDQQTKDSDVSCPLESYRRVEERRQ